MPFIERLQASEFAVALEITPPQKPLPGVLLRRARLIDPLADAVNVIQRPGRQTSLQASVALKQAGIEPAWHLVTRGRSRRDIESDCITAASAGIRQVLCIRGDHAGDDPPNAPTIRDTVSIVRERLPGALVGATYNQYAKDREAAVRNLAGKLQAGARYVQTQPVFDAEHFERTAEELLEAIPPTRLVAMVMPLRSLDEARQIERRLGIALPGSFVKRLETEELAWEAFEETAARLAACHAVAGAAVMTFEMDPPAGAGDRIIKALRRAGIGAQ